MKNSLFKPTVARMLAGMLTLATASVLSAPAAADPISQLNVLASETIFAGGRPAGAAPMLDFAMVHAAIHDAVQAYEKRFEPYAVDIPHATGSRVAAAARAARDVLVARFGITDERGTAEEKTAVIHGKYLLFLANHGLTEENPGRLVGAHAAAAIIQARTGDGSYPTPVVQPAIVPGAGHWRPTSSGPFSAPWLGAVVPFTREANDDQYRAPDPPLLTSEEYAIDYNEVKAFGRSVNSSRSHDQTQIGYFFSGNTIALFEGMIRGLVEACEMGPNERGPKPRYCKSLTRIGDSARLFALANLAGADAGITAWNSKKHFNFWRPVTAIQQTGPGDDDGNSQTDAEPNWAPLITTPPYPDYTSGANNLSGSFTTIAARFFDTDEVTFDVTSTAPLAVPNERTYHRFSDLAADVVDGRIFMGIHFRFADLAARQEGTQIATRVFDFFLRPVDKRGHGQ